VHFVCVGTPQKKGEYAADLSQVETAFGSLAPLLTEPCVVVLKSTVPVGTTERMATRLAALAPAGADVELVFNGEFLREGHAVHDTLSPDRVVVGVRPAPGESAGMSVGEAALRTVFADLIARQIPFIVTDYATAELVKVSANAFLSTKISFINAMAEVCEASGADVMKLAEALAPDPRIGGLGMVPGLGFGGGCLPKDIRAFMARAGELGADQALAFLKEVDAINDRRRARTVDLAREQCDGTLVGKRVAVWGATFKPETDDTRDSPALAVAAAVQAQGARVSVYDPRGMDNARKAFPSLTYAATALDAARDADLVLHLTHWAEFGALDPVEVGDIVAVRRVVDGRNALDAERWRAAGWTYRALGRP
jgi:UDPglucose 6-dehydrogenase